jgi:hypothetical protein
MQKHIQDKDGERVANSTIIDTTAILSAEKRVYPTSIPPISSPSCLSKDQFITDAIQRVKNDVALISEKAKNPKKLDVKIDLNPDFLADRNTCIKYGKRVRSIIDQTENFDVRAFLTGLKTSRKAKENKTLLARCTDSLQKLAKEVSTNEHISLQKSFQLIVGMLDQIDELQTKRSSRTQGIPVSTFAMRSAILLASNRAGCGLASWEVYTKKGKPKDNIWPFVENWKNWVPEAQGAMAKFAEVTITEARALAKTFPKNEIVLLKGGFGAGKTRQTTQLFNDNAGGVVAPDKGKRVVRRAMPEIPHAAAHVQGSQIAYGLF